MKPHDILKVKNVVEVHALRHGIQHLQFLYLQISCIYFREICN